MFKKALFCLPLLLFFPVATLAASSVSLSYPGAPGPLFSESGIYAGQEITKTVTINNGSAETTQISFHTTASTNPSSLKDKITLTVKKGLDTVMPEKTLSDLYSSGDIVLGNVNVGESVNFDFVAKLDPNLGNEYQNMSESFDMNMVYIGQTPPPTNPVSRVLLAAATALGFNPLNTTAITPTPTVAGVETQADKEVKGSEDLIADSPYDMTCPWWWIVGLIFIATLAIYSLYIIKRRKENWFVRFWYIWPFVFAFVAWFAHYVLEKTDLIFNRALIPIWPCHWYWFICIGLAVIADLIIRAKIVVRK